MTKNFLKNIFLNNISQGLQFGSRWLLTIILLRVLSIEMFAVFSFIYSISNILVSVLPFGSQIYLINKSDLSLSGLKELTTSISIIIVLFLLAMLVCTVYFLINPSDQSAGLMPLSIFLSLILSLNVIFFSFLKGVGNFSFELKIYSIFSLLILLLAGYLYFIGTLSIFTILSLLILLNSLMTFFVFRFSKTLDIKQLLGLIDFKKETIIDGFSKRIFFGLQELVTASYAQGGMLILFYIISNKIYGEYRAMLILTAPFGLVNVAVSQVLLSHLKKVSKDKMGKVFRKLHFPFVGLLTVFLIVIYFFGKPIVKLITGLEYSESIRFSYIGVLLIIFTSFVYAGYEMLLVVIDKQKLRFYVMFFGAVINILSIVMLLPKYGLEGAILTNVISNIAVFIGMVIITETTLNKLK